MKSLLIITFTLLFGGTVFAQTTSYFTDYYVYKVPDMLSGKWPEQWSAPKQIDIVIQFDYSNNIIVYTTDAVKKVYFIKKRYPEVDLNDSWKTRNHICTDKDGVELEIDIQRKISDNKTNILFIEPDIELMSLFTIKKKEN